MIGSAGTTIPYVVPCSISSIVHPSSNLEYMVLTTSPRPTSPYARHFGNWPSKTAPRMGTPFLPMTSLTSYPSIVSDCKISHSNTTPSKTSQKLPRDRHTAPSRWKEGQLLTSCCWQVSALTLTLISHCTNLGVVHLSCTMIFIFCWCWRVLIEHFSLFRCSSTV